ncbi:hypothetical protein BP5796_01724 [Coleophoma crateriformis]|uniref:WD40 repeat-like protein n=1 Tax=Coleophoma crateriformis TaxID=565419 RepID=A0A3D8T1C8_9HELO|nr:hypothetical protein BP5796_01724 [Coleophoma crateriformis]
MPTSASSLFVRLANVWRLLALRSDIDNIILELLGRFSLEKIYCDGDKEAYQQIVTALITQLNAIFYLQRLSLPSKSVQAGSYLGFLASWEVTFRTVEFVLQVVVDGRESLWEAHILREKYLAELLLSVLRLLTLHPKASTNQRKDRRERFARIHRPLEQICDSYPGSKSFLLLLCKETAQSLRADPEALDLPPRLRSELPDITQELYPLRDCLKSHYISTVVSNEDFRGSWLVQFLALRDITHFVVGASLQYAINGESRDVHLQADSARSRNAVLVALDKLQIPSHFSKVDLISNLSEMWKAILPDTLDVARRESSESRYDENAIDALHALCDKLNDRQIVLRISDLEVMHSLSQVTRSISHLDDPSNQGRSIQPALYAFNCQGTHLIGRSQLRQLEIPGLSLSHTALSEFRLPPHSRCSVCGEEITKLRELKIIRQIWENLRPLEHDANTVNAERHLPNRFRLGPPKVESTRDLQCGIPESRNIAPQVEGNTGLPVLSDVGLPRSRNVEQVQAVPHTEDFPLSNEKSQTETLEADPPISMRQITPIDTKISESTSDTPSSSDNMVFRRPHQKSAKPSVTSFESLSPFSERPSNTTTSPGKVKSKWMPKWTGTRKEETRTPTDRSSISSTALEAQRLEEISLRSLIATTKASTRGKNAKKVYVNMSDNSTHALFWTQSLIQVWDLGSSPPTLKRALSTESTCLLVAVTKVYLAYIIGTRDQKLTLRVVHLGQPSTPAIEYRMPSNIWCRSMAICPKENYVVVGFDNSIVRFFRTTNPDTPKEDRLHSRYHNQCIECPSVDTLGFSNDGLVLIASTRSPKNGMISVYTWRFPFLSFRELPASSYHVPLHESEDNGVSAAILRCGCGGEDDLICITTWTQSGSPILLQPEDGYRTEIKTDPARKQGKLGSRIQSAAFSPSGRELAMVNDEGHLYQISSLNSKPLEIKRLAKSNKLTAMSESFAMKYMILPDEEAIVLAWVDFSKAIGLIKKIPVQSTGEAENAATPGVICVNARVELPADSKPPQKPPDPLTPPTELNVELVSPEVVETAKDVAPAIPPKSFERFHLSDVQPLSYAAYKARAIDEQKCLVSQ